MTRVDPGSGLPLPDTPPIPVVLVDIDLPFWSLASFILKWTFAALPALFVIWLLYALLVALFTALGGLP